MLPEDEFVMGDIQVLAGLKMGSERLRLFFTPTRILVAHIGKRGVGSQAMGSFFGWLSGAIEDIFRSGKESFTKRESKMSTPKDILASARSEEHTSELQSRLHLVCRLLLEKKKKDPHLARPVTPTCGLLLVAAAALVH